MVCVQVNSSWKATLAHLTLLVDDEFRDGRIRESDRKK
jgi:hypothetical protein